MSNAAVEQLSKIISDRRPDDENRGQRPFFRRPAFEFHLHLDEGWFSLILVAVVVYSTIWSITVADWVDHLDILTWTTVIGLVLGVVAAKQRRLPRYAVHLLAILLALLLAFWQTSSAYYDSSLIGLLHGVQRWFTGILAGGNGEDDSIFLLFITALSFLLAYTSAWLVYRTRSPWLAILANAVVLLINLSNLDPGFIVFLVVFLLASLLLVLRFNLYESVKRWRRQGLRYADDLGWDVMQAGAIISIAILIFSWFLPYGYTNQIASQIWNVNANPVVALENTWNRIVSMSGGPTTSNHGNFRDTLVLGGNPNLNHDVVFRVQSSDPTQYLMALSYDTYDGYREWSNSPTYTAAYPANNSIPPESSYVHTTTDTIQVVNPPGEQDQYIFGPSQIGEANQATTAVASQNANSLVAVLAKNSKLTEGEQYTITSYTSSADIASLQTIPMPAASPTFPPNYDGQYPVTYFDSATVNEYLQVPKGLDPRIAALAKQITANAPTMYDKVIALENYFRSNYTYNVNINPPAGQEVVSWFLFNSNHQGFCNYFSTSMTIMARTLGIPTRVAAGYTNGKYDEKTHSWIIDGTDAHSWTQVYFAGYGWINFEPSAGFSTFVRPYTGEYTTGSIQGGTPGGVNTPLKGKRGKLGENVPNPGVGGNSAPGTLRSTSSLGQQVGYALGIIILLVLFGLLLFNLWWRRLFRNYKIPAQIFGRISLLANWAGFSLRPSQTPYEYAHTLTAITPAEAVTIERLSDIYVREIWADPKSLEHPERSGEINEMLSLWKRLQPRLFLHVLRHPSFFLALPATLWNAYRRWRGKHKKMKPVELPDVPSNGDSD